MAEIDVRDLTKTFGNIKAVDHLSFRVPSGKIYGFIGSNGAGKTTTLRIMAGMDLPDGGDIFYGGKSLFDAGSGIRRKIAFMSDSLLKADDCTVWEYIDFFLRASGMDDVRQKEAVERISEMTLIQDLAERKLSSLSKGLCQQVHLARVLLYDPEIILLDEPGEGLDPFARYEMMLAFQKMNREGKTILLSSHILSELQDFVSGIVVIDKGKVTYSGPVETKLAEEQILLSFECGVDDFLLEKVSKFPNVTHAEKQSENQILISLPSREKELFRKTVSELFLSELPLSGAGKSERSLYHLFKNSFNGEVQK